MADDEETFLQSTSDLLRREGYECAAAADADAALALLARGEYDLLVGDVRMRGNTELELVRRSVRLIHRPEGGT